MMTNSTLRVVHRLLWLFTGILIYSFPISTTANSNRYLYVPALGRSVQLGYLYNIRLDEFRDANVFRNSHFSDSIIETQTPRSTIETSTSNTIGDICELLGVDTNTAASILSGWLKYKHISGATADILKRTLENPEQEQEGTVTGTLVHTHQTVDQSLPLFYDRLKDLYNTDILAHKEATHIVSGITWGGRLAITFQDTATPAPAREKEQVRTLLRAEFLKLEGTSQIPTENENKTFDFTTFVHSDISLPRIEISSTKDVLALLHEFSNSLKNLNGGKGVQITYRLTPLRLIQQHLKVANAPNITAQGIPTSALKRLVQNFEDISQSRQLLRKIYAHVTSKPNCILPEYLSKVEELQSGLAEYKSTFTAQFKQVLFHVRSGTEEMSALFDLAQEYKAGNFNSKIIKSTLLHLDNALKKFEFCKAIEIEGSSENNVEYFGSRPDLLSIIYQNSGTKNIYMFFTKTEFTKNNPIKYTENLNYFMKTLSGGPHNKLLIVDCDFSHDVCSQISQPTIYEYKNNELSSTDFKRTVYDERMNLQEQINELKNNLTTLKNITENFEQTYEAKHSCSPNKCLNGGRCVDCDSENNFECICPTCFEGRKCEKQINPCDAKPCLNDGVCHSSDYNSYSCACASGFQGPTCADNVITCSSNNTVCQNGGQCIDEADGLICACPFSWAGKSCQYKLDPCPLSKCRNGARCISSPDLLSSTCTCTNGYTGLFCEKDVDECTMNSSLCQNGGTCHNTNGSYTCHCTALYEGNNCENVISDCLRNNDCINGATCVDEIGNSNQPSHKYLCARGFAGPTCSCNLGSSGLSGSSVPLEVVAVTECGGLIKVPNLPAKSSFLLDYKPNVTESTKEQCLWTLDAVAGSTRYDLHLQVTLLCDGFGNYNDTLSILGWEQKNSKWNLTQTILSKETPNYEPGDWDYKTFLHYVSTNASQSGFILRIDVLRTNGCCPGSNFVSKSPSGNQLYGPHKLNDVFSMTVIPPQANFTLTVDYLDSKETGSCQYKDALHIYKIQSVRSIDTVSKLCGSVTSPVSYASAHPIVVLHFTEKSTTGRGFSLSWK